MSSSPYKSTPVFTESTVPKGLLKDHRVKAGARAELVVESGELELVFPGPPLRRVRCAPECPGPIPSGLPHHVVCTGPVRFRVDFYREGGSAAPTGSPSTGLSS